MKNKYIKYEFDEVVMKFRILKYHDRYRIQVAIDEDKYMDVGSPAGYNSIEAAELHCKILKDKLEEKVVKEFEL